MFTGIVTDKGRISAVEARGDLRVTIATAYDTGTVELGAALAGTGGGRTGGDKGEGGLAGGG
jgi:riboflavin synthase